MELSLDRLTKQYGRKIAVDCVSATLKPGVYGLLGANGAGKTTLMRMLCAVLESTSGEVLLDGKEVTSMGADYRNVLGYLPQDFGYYPNYTAMEFLMYIAALKGIPKNVAKKRVTELLEVVDLSHVANKKVKTFSGGMKQRVGIAQALLNNPKILILDEPTAGLDPKANGKVWELSVSTQEARQWQTKTTVANLRHEGKEIILRIISDNMPSERAVPCEATLEDLYLFYFPTEEGVK